MGGTHNDTDGFTNRNVYQMGRTRPHPAKRRAATVCVTVTVTVSLCDGQEPRGRNIYEVLFSNDLQLGQTPSNSESVVTPTLRDFDKQNHHHTTGHKVVLLQIVRAPSTVPKSVVKLCSNYVEGWVLQSPLSAALLLALSGQQCPPHNGGRR